MPSSHQTSRFAGTGSTMLLLAGALAISACASKAPKELPPEPGPATTTQAPPSDLGPAAGSQADFAAKMMGADTIYFDTDKYDIDATDQTALAKQAQWLMQYPNKRATIEGHWLAPTLFGNQLGLHPLAVLLALFLGAELIGLPGALFAVPILVILEVLFDEFYPMVA